MGAYVNLICIVIVFLGKNKCFKKLKTKIKMVSKNNLKNNSKS
jgi:hypothetical protein